MWSDNSDLLVSADFSINATQSLLRTFERTSKKRDLSNIHASLKKAYDSLIESVFTLKSVNPDALTIGEVLTMRKNVITNNDALCALNFEAMNCLHGTEITGFTTSEESVNGDSQVELERVGWRVI